MRNKSFIRNHGGTIFIENRIESAWFVKVGLWAVNTFWLLAGLYILTMTPQEQLGKTLLGLGVFFIVFVFTLGRYLLWNLFGGESLTINLQSIGCVYHYGLFSTSKETIVFKKLGVDFCFEKEYEGQEYITLSFLNFGDNGQKDVIFETTVCIPEEKGEEIVTELSKLFENKVRGEVFNYHQTALN